MSLYRVKYPESESDIQIYSFFYTNTQKCQNTFEVLDLFSTIEHFQKINFLFCKMYNWYNQICVFLFF